MVTIKGAIVAKSTSERAVRYRPTEQLSKMRIGGPVAGKVTLPKPTISTAFAGEFRVGYERTDPFLLVVENPQPGAKLQVLVRTHDPAKQFDTALNIDIPEGMPAGRLAVVMSDEMMKEVGLNHKVPFQTRYRDAAGNVSEASQHVVNETISTAVFRPETAKHIIKLGAVQVPTQEVRLERSSYDMPTTVRSSRMAFDPASGWLTPGRAFAPGSTLHIRNRANNKEFTAAIPFEGSTLRRGRVDLGQAVGFQVGHALELSVTPPWSSKEAVHVGNLVAESVTVDAKEIAAAVKIEK